MGSIHDIEVTTIDGQSIKLDVYAGKTLLIVNVASKCGLTPQYKALEKLYQEKQAQHFEILGFPCNQFGAQEPGSEEEIQNFCSSTYGVSFPMFSKIEVNGPNRHPLYQLLMQTLPERTAVPGSNFSEKMKSFGIEEKPGDVFWNFEKFVISGKGEIVAHFSPDTKPDSPLLLETLTKQLALS